MGPMLVFPFSTLGYYSIQLVCHYSQISKITILKSVENGIFSEKMGKKSQKV